MSDGLHIPFVAPTVESHVLEMMDTEKPLDAAQSTRTGTVTCIFNTTEAAGAGCGLLDAVGADNAYCV